MTRQRRMPLVNLIDRQSRPRPPLAGRLTRLALLAALGSLALPAAATAQDLYSWSLGVLGGVGGSADVKPGSRNFSNATWQIEGTAITEPRTLLVARLGHLALGGKDTLFGSRVGADLSYVTLAGQYTFEETYYYSGVYIGLGGYRLGGTDAFSGAAASKTTIGGVIGVTGEFKATRRVGVLIELSGHYVDIKNAHIFGMAHGGLAIHF